MRYIIFFLLLNLYCVFNASADDTYSSYPSVDKAITENFSEDLITMKALKRLFHFMKMKQLSFDDDKKWEEYHNKYRRANYCAKFLVQSDVRDPLLAATSKLGGKCVKKP